MDTAVPVHAAASRRRRVAGGVVVVVVLAAAAAVAVTRPFSHSHKPPAATYPISTAAVVSRSLTAQTQVSAALGYSGAYTVVNQVPGLVTKLPAVGRVVRQGQVLYRIDGKPVVLLYGAVPAYRDLSYGMKGTDVAQLNVALGEAGSRYFGLGTRAAVKRLQKRLGVTRTGELALGQAVFLPSAARVTALGAGTVLGGPVQAGTNLLTASSTTPVVTADLDANLQTEVRAGDQVKITLPSGRTTAGVVSSIGRVATKQASTGTYTVTLKVTPTDPKSTAGLDRASVNVSIVTDSVKDVLVVPVGALLAQTGGGYAVEVSDARGLHLVTVTPGLFDDVEGLVQVTGSGLAAGRRVVVPTS